MGRRGARVALTTEDGATFRHRAVAEDDEGSHTLRFRAVDVAGNVAEGTLDASVVFDFTAPQIVDGSAALRLEPDLARNPLRVVDSARIGTTVTVTFLATEVLDGDPTLETTQPSGLVWTKSAAQGPAFSYVVDWGSSTPLDGTYDLRATLVDRAGNTRTATLSVGLAVDVTAPRPRRSIARVRSRCIALRGAQHAPPGWRRSPSKVRRGPPSQTRRSSPWAAPKSTTSTVRSRRSSLEGGRAPRAASAASPKTPGPSASQGTAARYSSSPSTARVT